ncbi:TPA: hypothetical protein DCP77_00170 [Candidatus Collierbacteria bacterium]|uniref:Uncharacterized protein n=1 Tax=Candidatus Collierbacteria bacterium GW2011_GWA2_42_17 TaxID=1618378 RepID=A0A0G1B9D1_9BACT|nr:MAG: hypothetical protein UU94_C0002G0083 [Candidatus Collierbacteria bacterium GW2011_GWB2_42_12]KKS42941.1 MAG: hypothetical protein UV06_C0004G0076 [Candidatus Collierbacteria bacterium GW2011_GWA2_42_17]KKS61702.1 MAG: hypothetical protein UV30_C0034G0011 [Candidatus Collierbacteria bacterium GW2011_GWF1_42_50]KKS62737.1 MAG: hypothetical protein UV28_C0005G0006 [Candidatus Collierbacteria bacterium GW2011_GWE2_42_48]KKS62861.1 MAG: hypothetical protein UV29_C0009G0016 [Candidatus Collie
MENGEFENKGAKEIANIRELFGLMGSEGAEKDTKIELMEAILNYLKRKEVSDDINNLEMLAFDKKELENREEVFQDELLALTKGDPDEELGEVVYTAWIKE